MNTMFKKQIRYLLIVTLFISSISIHSEAVTPEEVKMLGEQIVSLQLPLVLGTFVGGQGLLGAAGGLVWILKSRSNLNVASQEQAFIVEFQNLLRELNKLENKLNNLKQGRTLIRNYQSGRLTLAEFTDKFNKLPLDIEFQSVDMAAVTVNDQHLLPFDEVVRSQNTPALDAYLSGEFSSLFTELDGRITSIKNSITYQVGAFMRLVKRMQQEPVFVGPNFDHLTDRAKIRAANVVDLIRNGDDTLTSLARYSGLEVEALAKNVRKAQELFKTSAAMFVVGSMCVLIPAFLVNDYGANMTADLINYSTEKLAEVLMAAGRLQVAQDQQDALYSSDNGKK